MPRPFFRLHNTPRAFLRLCACALLVTVWFGPFSARSQYLSHANENPTSAGSQDVSALVQTGVDRYRAGAFLEAIAPWNSAYTIYETTQDLPALAIVSENLARAYQQLGQTTEEIDAWTQAIAAVETLQDFPTLGRLLTEQAQAYSRLGQHRRAIAILCNEVELAQVDLNPASRDEPTESALEAENALEKANSEQASATACAPGSALQIAQIAEDKTVQLASLGSLGEAYRLSGNLEKSRDFLLQGQLVSRELGDPVLSAAILNSLGNTSVSLAQVNTRRANVAQSRGDLDAAKPLQQKGTELNAQASEYFEQSYRIAVAQQDATAQMRSLLSLITVSERMDNVTTAQRYQSLAREVLATLPNSQTKAFAAIKLADFSTPAAIRRAQQVLNTTPPTPAEKSQASALLNQALSVGETIDNNRVISFALGKLGNLDERSGDYEAALEKTQAARLAANKGLNSKDSLYLWEWQIGRILDAQGKLTSSEQSYSQAIALLEQIRSDILGANRDLQFDFRDTVEPIYRQYAALNLREVPNDVILQAGERAFGELDTTLVTLDSLKVAELQSYFANDCVIVPVATRVDAVGESTATAVISTAILNADEPGRLSASNKQADSAELNQLAVIVSLPNDQKKISQVLVSEKEMAETINQFRRTLESGRSEYITEYDFKPSQQLYEWLIEPFEADLADIETLVFVNDGLLRSVPMAALHDGEQYLIEKFAVATTPSLTLTAPEKNQRPASLSALLMGVSEQPEVPGKSFDALPAVDDELTVLAQQLPNSQVLLNQDFSLAALGQQLAEKDYRILHMATHGTFGFDPADNFIVAGAKQAGDASDFNETLTISELDRLIRTASGPTREPIELLTLTACETAIGDNRSTLGLAGVAIRAGVRSAIATLWAVSDASSAQLISGFYDNLQNPDFTKAQALRQAQIAMIESEDFVTVHPYRWAPFTLIGNWL